MAWHGDPSSWDSNSPSPIAPGNAELTTLAPNLPAAEWPPVRRAPPRDAALSALAVARRGLGPGRWHASAPQVSSRWKWLIGSARAWLRVPAWRSPCVRLRVSCCFRSSWTISAMERDLLLFSPLFRSSGGKRERIPHISGANTTFRGAFFSRVRVSSTRVQRPLFTTWYRHVISQLPADGDARGRPAVRVKSCARTAGRSCRQRTVHFARRVR